MDITKLIADGLKFEVGDFDGSVTCETLTAYTFYDLDQLSADEMEKRLIELSLDESEDAGVRVELDEFDDGNELTVDVCLDPKTFGALIRMKSALSKNDGIGLFIAEDQLYRWAQLVIHAIDAKHLRNKTISDMNAEAEMKKLHARLR